MFGPIMRLSVRDLEIELAPLQREDMPQFITGGGMQSHTVTKYLGRRNALVVEDEYEWFDRIRTDKTALVWGIYLIEDGLRTLIGCTGLHHMGEGIIRHAVSGCMLFRPEYWGKGIMGASHRARTWYGFTHIEAPLVQLRSAVCEPNQASQKALERVGYVPLFTERNDGFVDGRYVSKTSLDCINPLEPFWTSWWHGDPIPETYVQARQRTVDAMQWAQQNVRFG